MGALIARGECALVLVCVTETLDPRQTHRTGSHHLRPADRQSALPPCLTGPRRCERTDEAVPTPRGGSHTQIAAWEMPRNRQGIAIHWHCTCTTAIARIKLRSLHPSN